MAESLGPVPRQHQEAVDAIEEIYGSSRMMLAALPGDLLQKVCCGNQCDMFEVTSCLDLMICNYWIRNPF